MENRPEHHRTSAELDAIHAGLNRLLYAIVICAIGLVGALYYWTQTQSDSSYCVLQRHDALMGRGLVEYGCLK